MTVIGRITFEENWNTENSRHIGRQESHALFGLSQANALLRVGVGQAFKANEIVDVQICVIAGAASSN